MNLATALRQALNPGKPVVLSKIRFRVDSGNRNAIHVKSTLDNSYKLDYKIDEDISFTDDDLIAIKNNAEDPCTLTFDAVDLKDGRRALLSPSRQQHLALVDPSISTLRSSVSLNLGGGETCMIRTSLWIGKVGGGPIFPV